MSESPLSAGLAQVDVDAILQEEEMREKLTRVYDIIISRQATFNEHKKSAESILDAVRQLASRVEALLEPQEQPTPQQLLRALTPSFDTALHKPQ